MIVEYYPDKDCHKYCRKQFFFLGNKNNKDEINYKNNLKVIN